MKKFRRLSMTLFDSSNANFKITLESQFTSGSQQTGFRDRVYITDKESGILNSSIFLTFAYKSEDAEPIYTSYPQIFKLRETFKKVIDGGLLDGSAFINDNGNLTVRPDHSQPINITNIGKDNNWISIRYAVAHLTNEDVSQPVPAVSIELSKSNHFASVLTVDEFVSVYSLLCDINLPSLQCMMALAYLDIPSQATPVQQQMYNPYVTPTPIIYGNQDQNVVPNYNTMTMQRRTYTEPHTPRYTNNYRQGQQNYRTTTPPPVSDSTTTVSVPQTQPKQTREVQTQELPTRNAETKPLMTQRAVEETEISEISYDDTEALNSLFDE